MKNKNLATEVCKLSADAPFKYYDKKSNTHKTAHYINNTPFWNKAHVLAYSGACGSGKTTCAFQGLTEKQYGTSFLLLGSPLKSS